MVAETKAQYTTMKKTNLREVPLLVEFSSVLDPGFQEVCHEPVGDEASSLGIL